MELPDDDSTKSRRKLHPTIVKLGRCGVVSLSPSVDRVIDDDALFKLVKKAPAASIQLLLVKEGMRGRALQIPLRSRSRKNISPRLVSVV